MRTPWDRIRHALGFEMLGLLLVTPLGVWLFSMPVHDIGAIAVISASLAMLWNYAYNLLFDMLLIRVAGHARKTPLLRIVHAVLFEVGLLTVLLPIFAWYLGISLWQALIMDMSFALFFMIHAFVYNWIYDLLFPVPAVTEPAKQAIEKKKAAAGLGRRSAPRGVKGGGKAGRLPRGLNRLCEAGAIPESEPYRSRE